MTEAQVRNYVHGQEGLIDVLIEEYNALIDAGNSKRAGELCVEIEKLRNELNEFLKQ